MDKLRTIIQLNIYIPTSFKYKKRKRNNDGGDDVVNELMNSLLRNKKEEYILLEDIAKEEALIHDIKVIFKKHKYIY